MNAGSNDLGSDCMSSNETAHTLNGLVIPVAPSQGSRPGVAGGVAGCISIPSFRLLEGFLVGGVEK